MDAAVGDAQRSGAPSRGEGAVEGLLVLVIDTDPAHWFSPGHEGDFEQLIASALVFVNAYLLLHRSNRIVIIAAHAGRSAMLYPNPAQDDTSGSAEQAAKVNAGVMRRLQELGAAQVDPAKPQSTAIAAALSRSLCCTRTPCLR
jgi:transcription initiation factor TFIIH subunit 3